MSNIREKHPFCVLFLVLFLAGCSGSNEIFDGSRDGPVTDEVTGALRLVVLPAVERLVAFSPVNQPAPPRAHACARFDPLCRSGHYEVCRGATEGAVVFRYERCERSTGVLDGSWELSQNGLLADARFDLMLDDLTLSGHIGYTLDDMCWRKEFDSFTATRGVYTATFDGSVGYCFATGAGSGNLRVSIGGPSQPFEMLLELDPTGADVVVVRGDVTTVCRFESAGGRAECETD